MYEVVEWWSTTDIFYNNYENENVICNSADVWYVYLNITLQFITRQEDIKCKLKSILIMLWFASHSCRYH